MHRHIELVAEYSFPSLGSTQPKLRCCEAGGRILRMTNRGNDRRTDRYADSDESTVFGHDCTVYIQDMLSVDHFFAYGSAGFMLPGMGNVD